MVTENTPYRNKKYIVEDFEFGIKTNVFNDVKLIH